MQQYFAEYGLAAAARSTTSPAFVGARRCACVLAVAPLARGLRVAGGELAFVTEAELYAGVVRRGRARGGAARERRRDGARPLRGAHRRSRSCTSSTASAATSASSRSTWATGRTEFLQLDYANDAKLYVPVSNLHLISRYSGASPEAAPLHELGSGQWEKAKKRAAQQAHDTAAELLNLYAQRAARKGHAFALQAARLRGVRRRLRLRGNARPGRRRSRR